MRRILVILLVSFVLGTLGAKLATAWQRDYLQAGDERQIDAQTKPLLITLGARETKGNYLIPEKEHADAMQADGRLESSPNLELTGAPATVRAQEVEWTETRNKRTVTRRAPGLVISVAATARAVPQESGSRVGEVAWNSTMLEEFAKVSEVKLRGGEAELEANGRILLRRFQVFPTAAAREAALVWDTIKAGAPLTLAAAGSLIWLFGFPKGPASPVEGVGLPVTFRQSYRGVRKLIGIMGCMVVTIVGLMFGLMTVLSTHVDTQGELTTGAVVALCGLVYLAVVAGFSLRGLREVTLTQEGVEVRTGLGLKLKFRRAWSELKQVEHIPHYKGNRVINEELRFTATDGKKIKVWKENVADFALLTEAAKHLHRQPRGAGGQGE